MLSDVLDVPVVDSQTEGAYRKAIRSQLNYHGSRSEEWSRILSIWVRSIVTYT